MRPPDKAAPGCRRSHTSDFPPRISHLRFLLSYQALSLLEAAGPEVTCQALDLARGHKALAEAAALELPHSPYRDGLLVLAE